MSYPLISAAAKELAGWSPIGDILDHNWYRYIRRGDKPYFQAIMLLGRIVYMYRPMPVLDPITQLVIGYSQKFQSDLWQQSRSSLAEMHGISRKDVDDAMAELKRVGVIWTELRTIIVNGQRMSNALYIGLNIPKLKDISTTISLQVNSYHSKGDKLLTAKPTALYPQGETNTQTTHKTAHKKTTSCHGKISRSKLTEVSLATIPAEILELVPHKKRTKHNINSVLRAVSAVGLAIVHKNIKIAKLSTNKSDPWGLINTMLSDLACGND